MSAQRGGHPSSAPARPIGILIAALGGQGGGVLAEWLVEVASAAGYPAQSTSIPGVAQRTGATTYYVEVFPVLRTPGAPEPVLSLLPVPGGIDLFVASELLEAARMVQAGMTSADRTTLVASTSRTLTTAEKMALGDGRFASDRLLEAAARHSAHLVAFDMDDAAREAGTIVSAVMLGAIAGSGVMPVRREVFEAAIRASGVGVEASLRGFARGHDATVVQLRASRSAAAAPVPVMKSPPSAGDAETASGLLASDSDDFPPAVRFMVGLGSERMVQFQDERYAELYRSRVARILAAERRADPRAGHHHALTRETARFLALWMAFDDIIRVAHLKVRASRFARVHAEVAAKPGDVVRIVDHFKPGIPEIVGLAPRKLGRRIAAWDRRRQARGHAPFALPMHIRADGIFGFLALRALSGLRGWRPRTLRYAEEQAFIERWLLAIESAAQEGDWASAYEIALAGRLVKGYGATNERGKRNLAHVLEHFLAPDRFATPAARAHALREAREAALADEGGAALDRVLASHGAPPREPVARPIVWMRKPPADVAAAKGIEHSG